MDKVVKEMYECDGVCKGTKYVLVIYDDNTPKLTFYNGDVKFEEENVSFEEIGKNGGLRVSYGTSKVQSSLPFKKYLDGTLDERWTKIK